MSEAARLVEELAREHAGDPWHGASVTDILKGVSASQAAARVLPSVHTIWELVLHMTAWKNEALARLGGAPAGLPAEGDWPEPGAPTPDGWYEALQRLDAAHVALVSAVRELPETRLLEPVNDLRDRAAGTGLSLYVLLHGIVQHDAYHAGQMAMLLRAMSAV